MSASALTTAWSAISSSSRPRLSTCGKCSSSQSSRLKKRRSRGSRDRAAGRRGRVRREKLLCGGSSRRRRRTTMHLETLVSRSTPACSSCTGRAGSAATPIASRPPSDSRSRRLLPFSPSGRRSLSAPASRPSRWTQPRLLHQLRRHSLHPFSLAGECLLCCLPGLREGASRRGFCIHHRARSQGRKTDRQ
jgi:hypothetical protein